jgi:hypothetical protein
MNYILKTYDEERKNWLPILVDGKMLFNKKRKQELEEKGIVREFKNLGMRFVFQEIN